MTATLPAWTKKKPEQTPEQVAAAELVRQARERGISLTGPDGLLKQLTKTVIETALNEEMVEHLGYEKHDPAGAGTGNIRNGTRAKTVLTDSTGPVEIEVPRDRAGTFTPQSSEAAATAQRRRRGGAFLVCQGIDDRGDLGALRRDLRRVGQPGDDQRITDKVLEEMHDWSVARSRGLRGDLHRRHRREGARRAGRQPPFYAAIGVTLAGERDILGLWAGTGGEGAKFWMAVLTDLKQPRRQGHVLRGL